MLNEMNEAGKTIGVRINRKKTQFMKNAYCEDGGGQLEGSQIMETLSYVYLGRSVNMKNDLKEELNRRMRAAFEILERCLLKFNRRTQHLVGLRSSERLNGQKINLMASVTRHVLSMLRRSLRATSQLWWLFQFNFYSDNNSDKDGADQSNSNVKGLIGLE
ncbi:hypothetical protein RB195_019725 [Necator americanus]|uniref:Reverse transcriptase domain-containing protein n=1 Tax=Necator americanus TaxID=51031 RepID=A0ABR1CJ24_NECAM